MRDSNGQSLKEVIEKMLKNYRLNDGLDEVRIRALWEELVGKMVAQHTKEMFVNKGTLFVKLDSSVLREELSYAKEKIRKDLNDSIGRDFIKQVVFR